MGVYCTVILGMNESYYQLNDIFASLYENILQH